MGINWEDRSININAFKTILIWTENGRTYKKKILWFLGIINLTSTET